MTMVMVKESQVKQLPMRLSEGLRKKVVGKVLRDQKRRKERMMTEASRFHCFGWNWSSAAS